VSYLVLAFPLRVVGGQPVTVDSDSVEAVEDQVEIVLRTPRGTFEAQPETGLYDLVGAMGPIGPDLLEVIAESVPNADMVAVEDLDLIATRSRDVTIVRDVGEG
jgi:hypothetical protein